MDIATIDGLIISLNQQKDAGLSGGTRVMIYCHETGRNFLLKECLAINSEHKWRDTVYGGDDTVISLESEWIT